MSALSHRRPKTTSPPSREGSSRKPERTHFQRRLWLFRFLLFLVPFVLLALAELGLRLAGYGYNPQFFQRLKIGNEDYFVQNEDFSRRFFPQELARHPGPVRFPAHKAPGTFRIFVLGESAAMGDPDQAFAPDRYLGILLREKYPDRRFEIINLAFTAINSHVIVPIARECAAHEGDLWILYLGNNEMVGPFGAATVFGWQAPPRPYVRVVLALQRWRIGQWAMALGRKLSGRGTPAAAWGGMGMFTNNLVVPDSPSREVVYRNFQQNLNDIVRAGLRSGVKVLLNSVAVNLKDSPPFASAPRLLPPDRAEFGRLCTNGLQAVAQKDWAKATQLFEQASWLGANSAELQFHWGEALLAQTNFAGAREHFQLACDNDALPFRADSRINAALRAERDRVADGGLIWCDAAAALAAGSVAGICGQETFFEHVHFDFDGRYRLGRAWAEQIEPLLPRNTNAWASQSVCERMLGLSPWNRAKVIHLMDERMQLPPLSTQANGVQRRTELAARMTELATQMTADNAVTARQEFLKLLEQRPEDYFLHQEYGVFLELTGDQAAAEKEWLRYRELVPQDSLGYYQAGRMFNAEQRYADAEASLRISTAMRPSRTDAWVQLGNALAMQQNYAAALACYSTALKQDSRNSQILSRRGRLLARLNRHVEAQESYRAAIQLNPADGLAHHELAVELLAVRDLEEAGKQFGEAARLDPDSVAARFDYGAWLMNQNHWDEAQKEFEAVLRLEPGNLPARQNLTRLQTGRQPAH